MPYEAAAHEISANKTVWLKFGASTPEKTAAMTPVIIPSCLSISIVTSRDPAANGIAKFQMSALLKGACALSPAIALAKTNPTRITAVSTRIAEPTSAKTLLVEIDKLALDE